MSIEPLIGGLRLFDKRRISIDVPIEPLIGGLRHAIIRTTTKALISPY